MNYLKMNIIKCLFVCFMVLTASCQDKNMSQNLAQEEEQNGIVVTSKLPNIDLNNWKVTLPIANDKGKPYEIEPPEILDFAKIQVAKPYMYIDSTKGAIIFHALPTESTTKNSKYSRSELREQLNPGSNNTNWTFEQGGNLKAELAMDKITKDTKGKYHKAIVLQIHGRLTNDQRDLIGKKDNNAPPMLKVYWQNGKIRIKTKQLKNTNATSTEILHEKAWKDDKGHTFKEKVNFNKFKVEVNVSEGKMIVTLNNKESKVYNSIHMKKWGIFENYFKAGNYFQSRDKNSYAKVSFYSLEVSH